LNPNFARRDNQFFFSIFVAFSMVCRQWASFSSSHDEWVSLDKKRTANQVAFMVSNLFSEKSFVEEDFSRFCPNPFIYAPSDYSETSSIFHSLCAI
jgi:hypothetical protein